jgi:hypothetical protein
MSTSSLWRASQKNQMADLNVLNALNGRSRKVLWRGCVAAVGGVHFGMLTPGVAVQNPNMQLVARKNFFALFWIAASDAFYSCCFVDTSQYLTTHDPAEWSASPACWDMLFVVCTSLVSIFYSLTATLMLKMTSWMPTNELGLNSEKGP